MDTPEIQMPTAGRRRGRYSDEFKHQVIAAYKAGFVSGITDAGCMAHPRDGSWFPHRKIPALPQSEEIVA